MSNIKQIQKLVENGENLKLITQGYSEIAASKLQKIRGSMEHNINFARELGEIYHTVQTEAVKRKVKMDPKIPGVVHILITSNNRFYGNLERPLTRYFATSTHALNITTQNLQNIRLVIGKTGPAFLHGLSYNLPFQNITFKADLPDATEMKLLTDNIFKYQTVLVYHSRFKTVLTQLPVVSEVTQSVISENKEIAPIKYIFEPELDQIVKFFQTQILQILLEQTFLESELARTASRLTAMDQAESNANDYLKKQKYQLNSAKRADQNAKSLEMVDALLAAKAAR
jgi:F-type H+-transporting ATPase subunit gamma